MGGLGGSSSASSPCGREGPGKQEEDGLTTTSAAAIIIFIIIIFIVIIFVPAMATRIPAAPGETLPPVKQKMDPPVGLARGGPARVRVNVCDCVCLCARPSVAMSACVSDVCSLHPAPPHPPPPPLV